MNARPFHLVRRQDPTLDRMLDPAGAVNAFIRDAVHQLSKVPYDSVTGQLPIRTDSFYWAAEHLARHAMKPAGVGFPQVGLLPCGTVEIRFVKDNRSLTLTVLAKRVVRWLRTLDDGQSRIEGHLLGDLADDQIDLGRMLSWLRGDQ